MALSERFFREKPQAWGLFEPLLEAGQEQDGFDTTVGDAIYDHYRAADRELNAERASAALVHYLYATLAASRLEGADPGQWLRVAADVTGFFLHVAASLDSVAAWVAGVFDMMLPRRDRPNLAGDEFAARFALIDLQAHGLLQEQRPWAEEVFAYRWLVSSRNAIAWSAPEGRVVVASVRVRSSEAPTLGADTGRTTQERPIEDLCGEYLSRLTTVLRAMFDAGAVRLDQVEEE